MSEDDKVSDPTVEDALRLTRTEWTIYWKTKYESLFARFVKGGEIAKKMEGRLIHLKDANKQAVKEIETLKTRVQEVNKLTRENALLREQIVALQQREKALRDKKITPIDAARSNPVKKKVIKKKKAVRKRG